MKSPLPSVSVTLTVLAIMTSQCMCLVGAHPHRQRSMTCGGWTWPQDAGNAHLLLVGMKKGEHFSRFITSVGSVGCAYMSFFARAVNCKTPWIP